MIKKEIRKATCDNWTEDIRAPLDVDERTLAEQFMRNRSFPFLLNAFPCLVFEGTRNYGRALLWRFEDRFGTTICFEITIGSGTEAWLKP